MLTSAFSGHRARLRERFEKTGLEGFAPHETLELLLTLAIPRQDLKARARFLIGRFGSLRGVLDAPLEELRDLKGLGTVAPIALKILREAAGLYLREQAEERVSLNSFDALENFWRLRLGGLKCEEFQVAFLDSSH